MPAIIETKFAPGGTTMSIHIEQSPLAPGMLLKLELAITVHGMIYFEGIRSIPEHLIETMYGGFKAYKALNPTLDPKIGGTDPAAHFVLSHLCDYWNSFK